MRKNILIIILLIVSSCSMIYAYIKAKEATFALQVANEQRMEAEKLRDQAVDLQEKAQQSAAAAREVEMNALRALEACNSKLQKP